MTKRVATSTSTPKSKRTKTQNSSLENFFISPQTPKSKSGPSPKDKKARSGNVDIAQRGNAPEIICLDDDLLDADFEEQTRRAIHLSLASRDDAQSNGEGTSSGPAFRDHESDSQ
jgi:hypothetical protein